MLSRTVEIWIALVCLALSLLAVFVWVPFDSETPPIYTFRRQTFIGDAMLPMVAAGGIAIFAAIHLITSLRRSESARQDAPFDALTVVFFALFAAILGGALVLMFWAGPAALALFGPSGEEPVTYRQMRSTVPWKYIGFVLGGFVLVFGVTSLVEGKMSVQRALYSIIAVIALIVIFDVPFDALLLPPNGDF